MRFLQGLVVVAGILLIGATVAADTDTPAAGPSAAAQIKLPAGDGDYAKLVARAAVGDESVDFRALRLAYLKSDQHKLSREDKDKLERQLGDALQAHDSNRILNAAVELLSADYIDMYGHKYMADACVMLKDAVCEKQAHFAEMGLLRSILKTGDGKTCATGWEVVTIAEEYFMLSMVGADLKQQALINGPPSCDQMDFTNQDGKPQTYYFRIEAVLADEASMFSH